MHAKVWLLIGVFVLLAACQPAALSTQQATLQPLRVQLTPLLEPSWLPKIHACSEYLTQSNLLIEVREASELDLQSADLIIRTSSDLKAEQAGTYLGAERLALVVNPKNPIISLSQEEAMALLSGAYAQWKEVQASASALARPAGQADILSDQELDAFLSTASRLRNIIKGRKSIRGRNGSAAYSGNSWRGRFATSRRAYPCSQGSSIIRC